MVVSQDKGKFKQKQVERAIENAAITLGLQPADFSVDLLFKKEFQNNSLFIRFSVDFPEDDQMGQKIVETVEKSLSDLIEPSLLTKFYDKNNLNTLKNYYEEVYGIENDLREIISFIFMDTYQGHWYDLTSEFDLNQNELKKFKTNEKEEFLKRNLMNEFFFLSFSQYVNFTSPKKIALNEVIRQIVESSDFDSLKFNLNNRGIHKEKYLEFLAQINDYLEVVEQLRNSVAHNRPVHKTLLENYPLARDNLVSAIGKFWDSL